MELRVIRESPIAVKIDPIQRLVRWLARGSGDAISRSGGAFPSQLQAILGYKPRLA
jgi:hypothetical protein